MRGFSESGDGYARIQPSGIDHMVEPSLGGVLFVDVDLPNLDIENFLGQLRSLRPSAVGNAQRVVFRSPFVRHKEEPIVHGYAGWKEIGKAQSSIVNAFENHGIRTARVGVVEFPIGADPKVSGEIDSATLARCRSIELEALLDATNAVWFPKGYHYRLPSGHHARSFIRVAEVFRDFRAAAALGSWLHASLAEGQLILVDSGTLSPLVHYLKYVSALAFSQPFHGGMAQVMTLATYPRSRAELRAVVGEAEHVETLGLLSVSSSGSTHDSIRSILSEVTPTWRTECLVDRSGRPPTSLSNRDDHGSQVAWLGLSQGSSQVYAERDCRLCQDPKLSPIVHIHYSNFAAVALPEPQLIMPDVNDAIRNRPLFDEYLARSKALERELVHLTPQEVSRRLDDSKRRTATDRRMRFEPVGLLSVTTGELGETIRKRLNALSNLPARDPSKGVIESALAQIIEASQTVLVLSRFDMEVVSRVVDSIDTSADAGEYLLKVLKPSFPLLTSVVLSPEPRDHDSQSQFEQDLRQHENLLFFATGLQTGITMQHLVVDVQDAFRGIAMLPDPQMTGLVLHAHPSDRRAWKSVRNTFMGPRGRTRLLALWLSYLPELSPFGQELDVLKRIDLSTKPLSEQATTVLEARLKWLNEAPTGGPPKIPPSPFMAPAKAQLRRTSIYGSLDDRYSLAAVGTAMQSARERAGASETLQWVQYDLPNVFRSYFDGILLASILRWGTPTSLWWGRGDESVNLLVELRGRFADSENNDWSLLLCELLLAASQGKVPANAAEFLETEAKYQLRDSGDERWSDDVLAYVELCFYVSETFRIAPTEP